MNGLACRQGTVLDRAAILGMRDDIYGGSDYLPAYIDHFLQDSQRICLVCEMGNTLVGFCCLYVIDGGSSYALQAGRVRKDMEGKGVMRFLLSCCRQEAKDLGCVREVSLCSSLNQHINKPSYRNIHTPVLRKKSCRYWLGQNRTFDDIKVQRHLTEISEKDLDDVISSPRLRQYLFPNDRILVDLISFKTIPENVNSLKGRNTKFLSNIVEKETSVSGILSAFTIFPVKVTAYHSIFDVYGSDATALEDHVMSAIVDHAEQASRGLSMTIVVDTEQMAMETRNIMARNHFFPWKWDENMNENCFYEFTAFETELE